jgi:hypothetical protein
LVTIVSPAYSVSAKAPQASQSMRVAPLMPASSMTQMKPAISAAAAGRRQALEEPLVDDAGIDIETRQPQRRAGAVDKRGDPAPA